MLSHVSVHRGDNVVDIREEGGGILWEAGNVGEVSILLYTTLTGTKMW